MEEFRKIKRNRLLFVVLTNVFMFTILLTGFIIYLLTTLFFVVALGALLAAVVAIMPSFLPRKNVKQQMDNFFQKIGEQYNLSFKSEIDVEDLKAAKVTVIPRIEDYPLSYETKIEDVVVRAYDVFPCEIEGISNVQRSRVYRFNMINGENIDRTKIDNILSNKPTFFNTIVKEDCFYVVVAGRYYEHSYLSLCPYAHKNASIYEDRLSEEIDFLKQVIKYEKAKN